MGYPVPPEEIHRIYVDLAMDASAREANLQEELPIETTAAIHAHLRTIVEDWESGRKSLRSVPACNAYSRQVGRPVEASLKRMLTGLDASVNVLDDIIDTGDLSSEARIRLTVNAAFSALLIAEHCPPDARSAIRDQLRDYFTALFQIPLVERNLLESMRGAKDEQQRQRTAEQIYLYRSRDIDAFAHLPATATELGAETEQRLLRDLRAYRARRLLFKDIHDVERDLTDDDTTPVIHLLQCSDSVDATIEAVENLYHRFSYSERGRERYGEVLRELERPPGDLRSILSRKKELVNSKGVP